MKPVINDDVLRDSVRRELDSDPELVATHISVDAVDGAVTLRGHVLTLHEKHVAVRAAERVDAVRAVADEIEVRESSLHDRPDDEIAEEVAHRRWEGESPDSVGVQVRHGRVILHGHVDAPSQREAAESAARQVAGVREVDNLIKVRRPAEALGRDVEQRVQEAVRDVAPDLRADSLHVTMEGGTARLRGRVPSPEALQAAVRAAETAGGVEAVACEILVARQSPESASRPAQRTG